MRSASLLSTASVLSAWAGSIVNLERGDIVEWLRFDGAIRELFDVQALPGVVCPMTVENSGPDLASFVSIPVTQAHASYGGLLEQHPRGTMRCRYMMRRRPGRRSAQTVATRGNQLTSTDR